VFHLMAAPGPGHTDALESYSAAQDTAVAIITRDGDPSDTADLRLRGLYEGQTYQVRFQNDPRVLTMSGDELMRQGIRVYLPDLQSSEIVYAGR